jgi:hypothetical protein
LRNQHALLPHPLIYRWGETGAPPTCLLRPRQPLPTGMPGLEAPPWVLTGDTAQPFDFCGHVQQLCCDIATNMAEFRHIEVSRLLFGVTLARNNRVYGLQARVTPLRFPRGQLTRQRRGVTFQVQRYFVGATEFLYLVTFCLPRFLDQDFDDKLVTLFHELYHISPAFDGDLRRHAGRYCVHSRSQRRYDAHMAELARHYLAGHPDPALHGFLRLNFAQLAQRHGGVRGVAVPRPKMVPIGSAARA